MAKNIVIEAGAGTGKTTRLVQAILDALIEKRLPLTSIVALTFTKKAAGEMKERIAKELRKLLADENLSALAAASLEQIDRASISTIHSFAFSLLKRFPLAAGIDPNAEVDEKGFRYDELFEKEWPLWLSRELGQNSAHEAEWLEILERLSLKEIETLARRLCDFDVPLDALPLSDDQLSGGLKLFHDNARGLAASHNGKEKASQVAQACEEILGIGASAAWEKLKEISPETREIVSSSVSSTKAWSEENIESLKTLQQVAANVLRRGDRIMALLTARLKPFAAHFRALALAEGMLSHSALLYLSRELLRKRHDIRLMLKREIRMLFIDEFQDTDPLQGELLLFLAEKPEGRAKTWQEVEIGEGKLFVVGDPKQSIYRFRGADIAAYRKITDLIHAQGGEKDALQKNYRSHDQIVHAINAAFGKIIEEKELISPAYIPLEPDRKRQDPAMQDVELRIIQSAEKLSSEETQEVEANDIAGWIYEHIPSPLEGEGGDGGAKLKKAPPTSILPLKGGGALRFKDIALIFRSSPPMRFFVEALRRCGIPYVVEGERYFYSTPEVTDFLNLLRVIENPKDQLALTGFLRSPLGGLTDKEILNLKECGQLSLMSFPRIVSGNPSKSGSPITTSGMTRVAKIYSLLLSLHKLLEEEPLRLALDHIFDKTFVLELAVGSYHRDQTIANLLKLRRLLETFAEEGATTLRTLLDKMKAFMENDRLEGESPLADENYDAVRLMTIHKAKGLEFPVIFLPGLHTGRRSGPTDDVMVDWSTGRVGLRAGRGFQNLEKLILDKEQRLREAEEEKRVLYVAMTRAKERLVLSGGITLKQGLRSDSYLKRLLTAWNMPLDKISEGEFPVGQTQINVSLIDPAKQTEPEIAVSTGTPLLDKLQPKEFAALWKKRGEECAAVLAAPMTINPSHLTVIARRPSTPINKNGRRGNLRSKTTEIAASSPAAPPRDDKLDAATLGTLLHRFLEKWDFHAPKSEMPAKLRAVADAYFASLSNVEFGIRNAEEGSAVSKGIPPSALYTPHSALVDEAESILNNFIGSPAYQEIAEGEILGREIPFFYNAEFGLRNAEEGCAVSKGIPSSELRIPNSALIRGTIDILYRTTSGQFVIGDYKSGDTSGDYEDQGKAYQEAVQRASGQEAEFKMIFLRLAD